MWYETWVQDTVRNLGGLREPDKLNSAKCEDVRPSVREWLELYTAGASGLAQHLFSAALYRLPAQARQAGQRQVRGCAAPAAVQAATPSPPGLCLHLTALLLVTIHSSRARCTHHAVRAQILNGTSWVYWAALAYWRGERIALAWDTLLRPSGHFGEPPIGARASITRWAAQLLGGRPLLLQRRCERTALSRRLLTLWSPLMLMHRACAGSCSTGLVLQVLSSAARCCQPCTCPLQRVLYDPAGHPGPPASMSPAGSFLLEYMLTVTEPAASSM